MYSALCREKVFELNEQVLATVRHFLLKSFVQRCVSTLHRTINTFLFYQWHKLHCCIRSKYMIRSLARVLTRKPRLSPVPPALVNQNLQEARGLSYCTWKTGVFSGGHRDDTRGVSRCSTESIVIEIPGLFPGTGGGWGKGAHNFRPSGSDDRGGSAPQALVIPRLKASFNIYDLFRFNSTCKREAYLYSAAAWLAVPLASRRLNPSRPGLKNWSFTPLDGRKTVSFSSNLNALRIFTGLRAAPPLIYGVQEREGQRIKNLLT